MQITIDLPDPLAEKLRSEAQRLDVEPSALARAAVVALLNREPPDAYVAMEYVLRKNHDLLKRLAQ